MAVTPGRKFKEVLSAKDLNPKTVRFLRYMILLKQPQWLGLVKQKTTIRRGPATV
jgi:hypothetical protein